MRSFTEGAPAISRKTEFLTPSPCLFCRIYTVGEIGCGKQICSVPPAELRRWRAPDKLVAAVPAGVLLVGDILNRRVAGLRCICSPQPISSTVKIRPNKHVGRSVGRQKSRPAPSVKSLTLRPVRRMVALGLRRSDEFGGTIDNLFDALGPLNERRHYHKRYKRKS